VKILTLVVAAIFPIVTFANDLCNAQSKAFLEAWQEGVQLGKTVDRVTKYVGSTATFLPSASVCVSVEELTKHLKETVDQWDYVQSILRKSLAACEGDTQQSISKIVERVRKIKADRQEQLDAWSSLHQRKC
jgi:hypothetical protein